MILERVTTNDLLVSTSDAKDHLRIDPDVDEDDLVYALVKAATQESQRFTNRQFLEASYKLYLDDFPDYDDEPILIKRVPVSSIEKIEYVDPDGVSQEYTDYQSDLVGEPARITAGVTSSWPDAQDDKLNAVSVEFKAGYGKSVADVPGPIVTAVKMWVNYLYDNRSGITVGSGFGLSTPMPEVVQNLLSTYAYREVK